jgi:hypothetical protein
LNKEISKIEEVCQKDDQKLAQKKEKLAEISNELEDL